MEKHISLSTCLLYSQIGLISLFLSIRHLALKERKPPYNSVYRYPLLLRFYRTTLVPVVAKRKKSKRGLCFYEKKKKVKSQNSVQYLFGSKPSCYGGSVHRNSQNGPAKLLPGTTLSISASSPIASDCVSICASTLCIL